MTGELLSYLLTENGKIIRTRTNNQSGAIRAKKDANPFLQLLGRDTGEVGKDKRENGDDETVEVGVSEDGEVDDDVDEAFGGSEAVPF